jgi:ubiquinol oxidase
MPAPDIAIQYWSMVPGKRTVRDLIEMVRADESNHRDVNHTFADIKLDEKNPYLEDKKHSSSDVGNVGHAI